MFISSDPLSGNYLDVYPNFAQNLIKNLKNGESIFLGADCFNATVHLKDGKYSQTTPSCSRIHKINGFRSVAFLENGSIDIYKNTNDNRWYFYKNNFEVKRLNNEHVRYPATSFIWQWSSRVGTDVGAIKENDWVSYSEDDSSQIEVSFQDTNRKSTDIAIGMKNYEIQFIQDDNSSNRSVYALQIDKSNPRRVRLCRRAMRAPTKFELPDNSETCALCTEDFADTPHIPWLKTSCQHHFHAVCFDRMKTSSTVLKCPLCRTTL